MNNRVEKVVTHTFNFTNVCQVTNDENDFIQPAIFFPNRCPANHHRLIDVADANVTQ